MMRHTVMGTLIAGAALALAGCGGDNDASDVTAFCETVEEARAAPDAFDGIRDENLVEAKAALEDSGQRLEELAEVAPDEIREDVERFQDLYQGMLEDVQDAETTQQLFTDAVEYQEQTPGFAETSATLQEFTNQNCGSAPGDASSGAQEGQ